MLPKVLLAGNRAAAPTVIDVKKLGGALSFLVTKDLVSLTMLSL